jgi:small nuclear ribonucleoprotein (snRNP)-like protein
MLSVAHAFHQRIIVSLNNSEHLEAFLPSWLEFKNVIISEVTLLHSQTFTNVNVHFLILVEKVTSQVLLQWPKRMVCCNV